MGAIITQKQNNKPWTLTWKASGRYPMVADRIYATLKDAQDYVDDLTPTASATPGLVLSVVSDPVAKNNGIYYVQSIAQAATETTEFVPGVLVAAGAGAGSEAVANYAAALAAATADNLGQILYVTNPTYKKGEGTTIDPDEADVDAEGNKIIIYTAGPYIVTGSGAVAKLGTTSATGDIAGDVENLKGRMSTAEGEIDALQAAVGDATKGLVADVAGIKSTIGDANGGLVKDIAANTEAIAANTEAVAELRDAVAGGVHFEGVFTELPGASAFEAGDIIIVAHEDSPYSDFEEPSKEYILVADETSDDPENPDEGNIVVVKKWVELGDVSVSDQKIAALEKEFDEHVAGVTAMLEPYALAANVVANETFNQHVTDADLRMDGIDGRLDGIDASILAVPVKSVTTGDVLKLSEAGDLSVDMSNFVTKDGNKVLSDENYSAAEKSKLEGIAAGAQVNVIETIKVNGSALTVEGKAVDIDLVNHLAGKVSINGQVLAETEDNGVLAAVVDASDINLSAAIGDHAADSTTVQSMLGTVYDIANSKIGSIHLAAGNTSNVLALSKTNIANDTIELKIAAGSAITATANGLDLVWTEL